MEPPVPDSAGPNLPICCLKVAGVSCFSWFFLVSALCFSKHTKPKYNDNHYWHATKQSKSFKQLAAKAWLRAIMVTALLWQPREHSGHIANAIRVLDSRTRPLLVFSLNINPPEAQTLNREMASWNHQSLTPPDQIYQSVV